MCGIAGIHGGPLDPRRRETILAMAGELLHRGPDGVGLYEDPEVALANTRLAILDLAGGDQPLSDGSGRFWVVQNGEIYNHQALRRELEGLGHVFATRSDTEVIAHAFRAWGPACLDRFNGPFALAVWDRGRRELFLARDRFGVRPLFYGAMDGALVFASEVKAVLRHPAARRSLDPVAWLDTFSLWAPLPDRTAFQGIRELPAGHWLRVGPDGDAEVRAWWDLVFEPEEGRSLEDLTDELEALLADATDLRLQADVPVGAYLSGGLDSSTLTALARRSVGGSLTCFGLAFEDARFDEAGHQVQVARDLGVDLHQVRVGASDISHRFPEVVRLAEKPLLRTAPAPMLALSEAVQAAGIKVVITGEGADELFGGYDLFREAQVRRFWAREPQSERRPRLFERLYPWLTRDMGSAPAFTRAFFATGMSALEDPLYSHRIRMHACGRLQRFLDPALQADLGGALGPESRLLDRLPAHFEGFSPLGKAQYLEIATFLQGYLLHSQGDRMLMGHGVEGRFPFLDHRVAAFAARLPDHARLCGLRDKVLLRRVGRRLLPGDVAARPKRPYRAPIVQAFLAPDAPAYVRDLLTPDALATSGLFQVDRVRRLVDKCRRHGGAGLGEMDEMAFMGILSTQLLVTHLVTHPSPPRHPEPRRVVVGDRVVRTPKEDA